MDHSSHDHHHMMDHASHVSGMDHGSSGGHKCNMNVSGPPSEPPHFEYEP
jgi:copper transporter 1